MKRGLILLTVVLVFAPIYPVHAANGVFSVTSQSISWSTFEFTDSRVLVQSANEIINVHSLALDPSGWLYWASQGAGTIRRVSLDGSVIEDVVTGFPWINAVALDSSAQVLYWAEPGGITRAGTDGSNQEQLVTVAPGYEIKGMAIDTMHGIIFLVASDATNQGYVQSANLDGSNLQTLVSDSQSEPSSLAVDPVAQKIYWSDRSDLSIHRANYDGSDASIFRSLGFSDQNQFPFSFALSVDAANRHLYWFQITPGVRSLMQTGLDNSSQTVLQYYYDYEGIHSMVFDQASQSLYHNGSASRLMRIKLLAPYTNLPFLGHHFSLSGMVFDPRGTGKLYWSDIEGKRIFRSNLDGSDLRILYPYAQMASRLSIDFLNNRIFWAEMDSCDPACKDCRSLIFSASLDGSNNIVLTETHCPVDLAGDRGRNTVYWIKSNRRSAIYRHTTQVGQVIIILYPENISINGLMTDTESGTLYWLTHDSDTELDILHSGNSNGVQFDEIVLGTSGSPVVALSTLDPFEDKIYWTQQLSDGVWIRRCNLDFTGVEDFAGPIPGGLGGIFVDTRHTYCTRTEMYADITNLQGIVEFGDISAVVDAFKGQPSVDSTLCDLFPCDLGGNRCMGDGIIDFQDISQVVNAFRGVFNCPQ